MSNYIGSSDEALDFLRSIHVRDRLIAELTDALREAVEIIEGTGLDASTQKDAIQKVSGAQA